MGDFGKIYKGVEPELDDGERVRWASPVTPRTHPKGAPIVGGWGLPRGDSPDQGRCERRLKLRTLYS